jgi:hypothetical protein
MVGKPDAVTATMSDPNTPVQLGSFNQSTSYSGLAAFLGVPESTLAQANVIAFEFNGNAAPPSGGWESSRWVFNDGAASQAVKFNEVSGTTLPSGVFVATGSMAGANYRQFFSLGVDAHVDPVVSFLLFRTSVNTGSPNFSVTLTGDQGTPGFGDGTPDPDAIGVLN